MSTSINNFQNFQIYAQLLLANEMPVNEDTVKIAKTTSLGLKKCVEDIKDASVRPDVSNDTRTQAITLLQTVEKIQKTTIPMLRNKFSLGLSEEAALGIRLGSFLVLMGLDRYTGIFEAIQNSFIKNIIIGIASQKLNDVIVLSLD